jgi:hypothetical protein
MSPLVTVHGLEVGRSLLAADGGPFPTSYDGLAVVADRGGQDEEEDGPVPRTGWRVVDRGNPRQVVLLAPSSRRPHHWWRAGLDRTEDGWRAHVSWAEPERPARSERGAGLRLDWPSSSLELPAAAVPDLQVRIGRYADDGTRLPLDWDPEDGTHVVGHVLDPTTEEPLPFQARQAFAGRGPAAAPDAAGDVWLPLRWTTYDVERLPPGDYRVRAQLSALPVHTPTVPLRVTPRPAT